ncbi:hypothetical protein SAMN05444159_2803 [Bradyrhizobium lablabi]|uniref:Uncharacterized protein n=1 Tax=Bradyrhizobium lablabi TaxID=722472 RepID=A0A1M6QW27_9BRAD|nr:hypothetical protein SAMN05444159_2803 [Bradyrhizobium lablabi]
MDHRRYHPRGWRFEALVHGLIQLNFGPVDGLYGLYGLGMPLYFVTQGFGSVILTVTANAVRLLANIACALVAIFWLDLGAIGFCAYAALTAAAMLGVKEPSAG